MATVSRIRADRYDGILDTITDILQAPYISTVEIGYYLKHKDRIKRAFESVYGREPTDKEIYQIIEAYLKNIKYFGKSLSNRQFVLEIQRAVNKVIPRKIAEDGIFYFQTVAGIRKFQELRGIRPTGFLDRATILELLKVSNGRQIRDFYELKYGGNKTKKILKYVLIGGVVIVGSLLLYKLIKRA